MAEVMVRLDMAPAATVTIPVMTTNATATAGSDYTTVMEDVTVLSTDTGAALTKTVSIPISDDDLDEDDETFTVSFGALTGLTTGTTTSVTVTITDDDDAPQLTVAAAPTAIDEGAASTITITSANGSMPSSDLTVPFTITGTDVTSDDYTLTSGGSALTGAEVTLPTGATTVAITLTAVNDADEAETLTFTLTTPVSNAGYTVGGTSTATVMINPTTTVTPTVNFVAGTLTVAEDGGMAEVMVRLDMAPADTVTIPVMTTNATATAGSDYTTVMENVTVLSTDTGAALTKTVSIPISDDDLDEDDETFTVSFGALTGLTTGTTTSVTVTITDDDDAPQLTVAAAPTAIDEGATSTITITSANGSMPSSDLTVPFTITGMGVTSDDYTLTSGGSALTGAEVTLPTGASTVAITLTAVNDADEAETLTFTLTSPVSNAGYTVGGTSTATVMINPTTTVTPTVNFVAGTLTVAEDGGMAMVMVRLDMAPADTVTIPVMTTDATATAGNDYTAVMQDVTVMSTDTGASLTKTVSIPISDDDLDEDDETFTVSFGALTGVTAGATTSVTVTITDDDVPELSVAADPTAIDEGAASTITITANISPIGNLTIPFTITGTDVTSDDYTLASGGSALAGTTVTLAAGTDSVTITLTAVDDADEAETLTYTLTSPVANAGYTVGGTSTATVMINPVATVTPTVNFVSGTLMVGEDIGMAEVMVQLDVSPATTVTIPVMTTDATATAGNDYTAVMENVTVMSTDTGASLIKTVSISITDDTAYEGNETFTVSFGSLTGVTAGTTTSVTVTIIDNDIPELSVAADPTTIEEGATSTFTITANASPIGNLPIPFTITGPGVTSDDYTLTSLGTPLTDLEVTLLAGSTSVTVTLTAANDADTTETLTFTLTSPAAEDGYTVGTFNQAMVRINPLPEPMVSFDSSRMTVSEDVGTVEVDVTLTTGQPASTLTIPVVTMDGTATATGDYTAVTQNVIFLPTDSNADLTKTVSISITDDTVYENNEIFTVMFGALTGVTSGVRPSTTVTITDEDTLTAGFAMRNMVAEGDGTVDFTLSLSASPAVDVTIPYSITAGTAMIPADVMAAASSRSVTFMANATGPQLMQIISITIVDDMLDEADETFTLALQSANLPPRVTGSTAELEVTITDNDVPVISVSAAPALVNEGQASTITITSNTAPIADLTVPFTIGGTDITDADYTLASGGSTLTGAEVTLAAGANSVEITLTTADDADTAAETLTFTLTAAVANAGYTVGAANQTTVTINPTGTLVVSFTAGTAEVSEDGGTVDVMVNLDKAPAATLTIPVVTIAGTATAPGDYTAVMENVTFMTTDSGEDLTKTVTVTIIDDDLYENEESFTVAFGTLSDISTGTDSVTITITDEETLTVGFTSTTITATEDMGTVDIDVELVGSTAVDVTIDGIFIDDSAYFQPTGDSVTFPAGATGDELTQSLTAVIIDNMIDEDDRQFNFLFQDFPSERVSAIGGREFATVTVVDNDAPQLSVSTAVVSLDEGGAAGMIEITADILPVSDLTVPFTIAGMNVTADDYTLTSGGSAVSSPLTFPATRRSLTLTLTAVNNGDTQAEMLAFTLSPEADSDVYTVGSPNQVAVTINPAPAVEFISGTATATESSGTVTVMVRLSRAPASNVTIPIRTMDGTATAGEDYTALTTESVTFRSSDLGAALTKTVSIDITDDGTSDNNENFTVIFGTLPDSVRPGPTDSVTVTITDT